MRWDSDHVQRSIRRYVGEATPSPPWRLRTERRYVKDDDRPVAVVQLGDSSLTRFRESLEQGETETLYPVTVTAYPEVRKDERLGRKEAEEIRFNLQSLILTGAVVRDEDGRDWAGPARIPLWDYDGIDPGDDDSAAELYDVLWVTEGSVAARTLQDPEDPKRWTVVLEFRVTVEAPGRVKDPDALPVEDMPGEFVA